MKISGLPRAKYDECLSSWLWRVSFFYSRITSVNSKNNPAVNLRYAVDFPDPDFDLSFAKISPMVSQLRLSSEGMRYFFKPQTDWVLPPLERRLFCYECLAKDISMGTLPYWRKSWCYLHCPICPIHFCLLDMLEWQRDFLADRSWQAFSYISNIRRVDETRRGWREILHYNSIARQIIIQALRIQNMLTIVQTRTQYVLPGDAFSTPCQDILKLVRFLFENLLYPRLRTFQNDGVCLCASHGLPRGTAANLEDARAQALTLPQAFPRISALMLIGTVLGITEPLSRGVQSRLELWATLGQCTPWDIGRCCVSFARYEDPIAARSKLTTFSPEFSNRISEFIEGALTQHVD